MWRAHRSGIAARALTTTPPPPRPLIDIVPLIDFVKHAMKIRAVSFGVLSVTGLGVVGYGYRNETEAGVTRDMVKVFRKGGVKGWDERYHKKDEDASVERPALQRELCSLLRPERSEQYVVIVGENGVGKSTVVRQVVRSLADPKGVIYVLAPTDVKAFGAEIATAVGYRRAVHPIERFRRFLDGASKSVHVSDPRDEPLATWRGVGAKLMEVGIAYQGAYSRPAVLVIDAADRVAKEDAAFFLKLQEFAKDGADSGSLIIVLVLSAGAGLPELQAASAWSRALKPPFEIGDVGEDEAVQFLVRKGVEAKRAGDAVQRITGGRFALLNDFASASKKKSNETILDELHKQTRVALLDAGVEPTHELFEKLVHGEVDIDVARRLLAKNKLDILVQKNVLAVHPDGTYTFHAVHTATLFEDLSAAS